MDLPGCTESVTKANRSKVVRVAEVSLRVLTTLQERAATVKDKVQSSLSFA